MSSPKGWFALTVACWLTLAACTSAQKESTTEPSASGPSSTSTASVNGVALLITDHDGIWLRGPDGSERLLRVEESGPLAAYFTEISAVFSDGEGGLVFQHVLTPPPWPNGSVLWLPAGSSTPQLLVTPGAPEAPVHTLEILPLQVTTYAETPAVLYDVRQDSSRPTAPHVEHTLLLQRLAGGRPVPLLDYTDPPRPGTGNYLQAASWGAGLLVTVWGDGDFEGRTWLEFFDDSGAGVNHPHNPIPAPGIPAGPRIGPVFLSRDDPFLIYAERSPDDDPEIAAADIVVYDLAEGVELARFDVGPIWAEDRVSFDGERYLTVSHQGFYELIDITSGAEPKVVRFTGTSVVPAGALDLAADANLGSPAGLICSASSDRPSSPQRVSDVPAQVTQERSRIVDAARACDFQGVARLKTGGAGSPDYEGFLRELLVAERNGEPLLHRLVGVLELAYEVEGIAPNRTYVWPSAVFPTLNGWTELAELYSEEEISEFINGDGAMLQPSTYGGVAVGITEDGRWVDPTPRNITLPPAHGASSVVGRYGLLYPNGSLPVGGFRLVTLSGRVEEVVDPSYASMIKILLDDLAGGIVFQYLDTYAVATPPTYRAGSILRLAVGADRPEVIRQPNDRQMLFLLEVDEIEGVPSLVYAAAPDAAQPPAWAAPYQMAYNAPRSLYIAPLKGGPARLIGTWGDDPEEPDLLWASYGDGRLLLTLGSAGTEDCRWFEVVELGGGMITEPSNPRPGPSSCDDGTTVRTESFAYDPMGWVGHLRPSLSRDGSVIVYEERSMADVNVAEIVMHSVAGGTESRLEVDLGIAYDRHRSLIIYTKDDADQVLIVFDHDGTKAVALPAAARLHVLALLDSKSALAPNATLDSGAGGLVCSASGMTDLAFELFDPPAAVVGTRGSIIAYAVACDYRALAELAASTPGFTYSNLISEYSPWLDDWRCYEPNRYALPPEGLVPYWVRDDVHAELLEEMVNALNGPYRVVETGDETVYVWGDGDALIQIGIVSDGRWRWATTWDDEDPTNDPCSEALAG